MDDAQLIGLVATELADANTNDHTRAARFVLASLRERGVLAGPVTPPTGELVDVVADVLDDEASYGTVHEHAAAILAALRERGVLAGPGETVVPVEAVDVVRAAGALVRLWVETEDSPGEALDRLCDEYDRLPAASRDRLHDQETTA